MSQMHSTADLAEIEVDRLHRSLRISGLTAGDMARLLDVHRNTIGNWLSGRTQMTKRNRIAWAMACGRPVTAEWIEKGVIPERDDPDPGLPRLDSNQQPFGYKLAQVIPLRPVA